MYIVEFLPKEQSKTFKKFLGKNKVNSGKQLSLSVAETLIQNYQSQCKQDDQVVIQFQDLDNEKAYEFELPVRTNEKFALLKAVEEDLDQSGVDFSLAMEIKQGLYQTYKEEKSQADSDTATQQAEATKGGLFKKFFNKKQTPVAKEATPTSNKNNSGVKTKFDQFSKREELSDFKEMSEEEMTINHTAAFDENQIAALEEEAQNFFVTPEDNSPSIPSGYEAADFEGLDFGMDNKEDELPVFMDGNEGLSSDEVLNEVLMENPEEALYEGLYEQPNQVKKEEPIVSPEVKEVDFPHYDKYLDLSEVEIKQERYSSRFSVYHLLSLLGIDYENPKTELELRKVQYAKQLLNSRPFLAIEDQYHQELKNTLDEIRLFLQQTYKDTMLRDYPKEAEVALKSFFEEQLQNMILERNDYENKEKFELEQKLGAFKEQQRLALEAFQVKQAADLREYASELEARKTNLIQTYQESITRRHEQEQKQAVQNKIYELKTLARKELIDKKNDSLSHYVNTIENLMNVASGLQQNELARIEEAIKQQVPVWSEEIETTQQALLREQEAELERQRLEVEKQRLELEERKLNEMKGGNTDKEMVRMLQNQLYERERQLQQTQQAYYGMHQQQQPVYQQPTYQQQMVYQQPVYQQPQQAYQQPQQGYQQPQQAYQQPQQGYQQPQQTYQQPQQGYQQPQQVYQQPPKPVRRGIRQWLFGM